MSKEVGKVQPRKTGGMPEAGGVHVYSQILLRPQVYQDMKARTALARKGIRGELGNKGKMIQGEAEGTEVRGAFGGKQVMTHI